MDGAHQFNRGHYQNYHLDGGDGGYLEHSMVPDQYVADDSPLGPEDSGMLNQANYHFNDRRYQPHPNYELSNAGQYQSPFVNPSRTNPFLNHSMFQPSYPMAQSLGNPFAPTSPISDLRQQYNQLQQDKMQERIKVETEALVEQQQKFALRQQLNPPVPESIYASRSNFEQFRPSHDSASAGMLKNQNQTLKKSNNVNGHGQQQPFERFGMYSNQQLQQNRQQAPQQMDFFQSLPSHMGMGGYGDVYQDRAFGGEHSQQNSPIRNDPKLHHSPYKKPNTLHHSTKLLKSPVAKRPDSGSVTFSGWLYKQGSDGLRVWRKRWFVLSDYCLYYYKSAEEEKLLGSILLPSYSVSMCLPDSKNFRKHSFKLEHKNMRTFLLASENIEGMYKWVRILDAATRMQTLQDVSPLENSSMSSDVYGNNVREYLAAMDSQDILSDSSGNFDREGKHKQPLYVNAPPKPRRSRNELGYWTLTPKSSRQFLTDQPKDHRKFGNNTYGFKSQPFEYEDVCDKNNAGEVNLEGDIPTDPKFRENMSRNLQMFDNFRPIRSRPGSVDLFEHDAKEPKHHTLNAAYLRSKSSLEINTSPDNYFYSEANYAAKMRQSAHYLQNTTPKKSVEHSIKSQLAKLTTNAMGKPRLQSVTRENSPGLSVESYQRSGDASMGYEQNDGSMKRLLVWKQKMLMSPLTRNNNMGHSPHLRNNFNLTGVKQISKSIDHINTEHVPSDYGYKIGLSDEEGTLNNRRLTSNYLSASQNRINDIKRDTLEKMDPFYGQQIRDILEDAPNILITSEISAGSLLTKSHEELVLLLIQLRRQNILTGRTIDMCNAEIKSLLINLQSCTNVMILREYKDRLDRLSKQIVKLERQYEKKRPLINLLDNMVKLGALYRNRDSSLRRSQMLLSTQNQTREQLQYLHEMQERNILKDENKYWLGVKPNQKDLQDKVSKLYKLDQIIQEESNALRDFQQNKVNIKGQLDELNHSLIDELLASAAMIDKQKKKDFLELELSRVHDHMATKSRKLERELSGNLRLENELLALKQKFEIGRSSKMGDIETESPDIVRQHQLSGDLHKQRQHLSQAVLDFTEHSHARSDKLDLVSNTDFLTSSPLTNKLPNWAETDLDVVDQKGSIDPTRYFNLQNWSKSPLNHGDGAIVLNNSLANAYRDDHGQQNNGDMGYSSAMSNNEEFINNMNNFGFLDKQEIKTVRIVKRESEKRHRDREKGIYSPSQMDDSYDIDLEQDPSMSCREFNNQSLHYTVSERDNSMQLNDKQNPINISNGDISYRNSSLSDNLAASLKLNSGFQSQSARHIISGIDDTSHHLLQNDSDRYRRSIPKKKKRHFTAPNTINTDAMQDYLQNGAELQNDERWRARDDLDMEVALRSNIRMAEK